VVQTNEGVLLAAANPEGVYRSADRGQTWNMVHPSGSGWCCWTLAVSPINGDVYLGGNLLRRSTDGGVTWEDLPWYSLPSGPGWDPNAVAVDGKGRVYVGCPNGVLRTNNNGQNWEILMQDDLNKWVVNIAFGPSDGEIYAYSGGTGLYRSLDDGSSWTLIKAVPSFASGAPMVVTPKGTIIGSFWAEDHTNWLYRSTDSGNTWSVMYYWGAMAFTLGGDGRVFMTQYGGQVSSSQDDGASWTPLGGSDRHIIPFALALDSDGYLSGGISGVGVWRSVQPILPASP